MQIIINIPPREIFRIDYGVPKKPALYTPTAKDFAWARKVISDGTRRIQAAAR